MAELETGWRIVCGYAALVCLGVAAADSGLSGAVKMVVFVAFAWLAITGRLPTW